MVKAHQSGVVASSAVSAGTKEAPTNARKVDSWGSLAALAAMLAGAVALHAYNLGHPDLAPWDEAVHAVVAEHLAVHPLHPTLFEVAALTPSDFHAWTYVQTWVHIPPVGMWSSALAMKLLGDTPLADRLPGLVYVALAMVVVYLLGSRLFTSAAGLIGALFVGYAPYPLLLSQGYVFGDTTDTPLMLFTPLAMLGLVQAYRTKSYRWLVLAGACQGLCYLTKNGIGLTPSGVLLVLYVCERVFPAEAAWSRLGWRGLATFAISAFAVAGPYIAFISWKYPASVAAESGQWTASFFSVQENWGRPWDFHVTGYLYAMYGSALAVLLLSGFALVAIRALGVRSRADLVVAAWIAGLYLPLSFAVTKAVPFTYAAVPAIGLAVGRLATLGLSSRVLTARVATLAVLMATATAAGVVLVGHVTLYEVSYAGMLPPYIAAGGALGQLRSRILPYVIEIALALMFGACYALAHVLARGGTMYTRVASPMRMLAGQDRSRVFSRIKAMALSEAPRTSRERVLTSVVVTLVLLILSVYWLRYDLQVVVRPPSSGQPARELGSLLQAHTPANATVYMTPDSTMGANTHLVVMFWAHRDVYTSPISLTRDITSPAALDATTVCALRDRAKRAASPLYLLTDQAYGGQRVATVGRWTLYLPACP